MATAQELQAQGVKLFQRKDYEAAAQSFQAALTQYDADGQPDMAAEMQVNIGLVHRSLGENQQALDIMQEALTTFTNAGDKLRAAVVLGNMGGVYSALKDKEQAYTCYRTAADVFHELGETAKHSETLKAMAALQMKDGKIGASAATYEAALSESEELTPGQKLIKGLIGIRNRLIGGGS